MEMCKRHAAKIGPPSRVWELMRQPWKPAAAFLARMKVNFGWRFCLILVSAYFGVKGALYTFAGLVQLPYYKSLGVSGRDYQIYGSIAVTPFSLKVDLSSANLHTARSVHTHTHTHTHSVLTFVPPVVLDSASCTMPANPGVQILPQHLKGNLGTNRDSWARSATPSRCLGGTRIRTYSSSQSLVGSALSCSA